MEEPGQVIRSRLMMGLRSAALVGNDKLRVRIGIASHRYSCLVEPCHIDLEGIKDADVNAQGGYYGNAL